MHAAELHAAGELRGVHLLGERVGHPLGLDFLLQLGALGVEEVDLMVVGEEGGSAASNAGAARGERRGRKERRGAACEGRGARLARGGRVGRAGACLRRGGVSEARTWWLSWATACWLLSWMCLSERVP